MEDKDTKFPSGDFVFTEEKLIKAFGKKEVEKKKKQQAEFMKELLSQIDVKNLDPDSNLALDLKNMGYLKNKSVRVAKR